MNRDDKPTGERLDALRWVKNTGYTGTKAMLFEDFEPIGPLLWEDLRGRFMFEQPDGRLNLTPAGAALVEEFERKAKR